MSKSKTRKQECDEIRTEIQRLQNKLTQLEVRRQASICRRCGVPVQVYVRDGEDIPTGICDRCFVPPW
jgi:hypothetical protein